jgi:hypothetical protein
MTVLFIVLAIVAVQLIGLALFRSLARSNERFDAEGNVRSAPTAAEAGAEAEGRRIA